MSSPFNKKLDPMKAPPHLSREAKKWWRFVASEFELDEANALVLRAALESFDRLNTARKVLDKEGLTCEDRFGQVRARPEVAIERDARIAFLRGWRQLGLDIEAPGPIGRPPG